MITAYRRVQHGRTGRGCSEAGVRPRCRRRARRAGVSGSPPACGLRREPPCFDDLPVGDPVEVGPPDDDLPSLGETFLPLDEARHPPGGDLIALRDLVEDGDLAFAQALEEFGELALLAVDVVRRVAGADVVGREDLV